MKVANTNPDAFVLAIMEAAKALHDRNISDSRKYISAALALNMDAPEPQNLLGILYELSGDDNTARKHYRAAYALDPTYKPACRNLERLVLYGNGQKRCDYDFGTMPEFEANRADLRSI